MKQLSFVLALVVCGVIGGAAFADAVPQLVNYQGKVYQPSGAAVPDGSYKVAFSIYDVPTGGTAIWTETYDSLQVKGSAFHVLLGSVNPIGASIFSGPDRFLGVKLASDPELSPRQKIASVPYAMVAASAEAATTATTVADGAITTTKIADGAVTATKLADGSVSTAKIADNSVGAAKVQDGAVTATKLSSSAIALGLSKLSVVFATASASFVQVPGLTVTATIPPGGRIIRISAWARSLELMGTYTNAECSIWDGPVGTGTLLTKAYLIGGGSPLDGYLAVPLYVSYVGTQTAGTHTYNVGLNSPRGGGSKSVQITCNTDCPAYLLVEAL